MDAYPYLQAQNYNAIRIETGVVNYCSQTAIFRRQTNKKAPRLERQDAIFMLKRSLWLRYSPIADFPLKHVPFARQLPIG